MEKSKLQVQQDNIQSTQASTTLIGLFTDIWKINFRSTTKLFLWKIIQGIIPITFLESRHLICLGTNFVVFVHVKMKRICFFIALLLEHHGLNHWNLHQWIKYWLIHWPAKCFTFAAVLLYVLKTWWCFLATTKCIFFVLANYFLFLYFIFALLMLLHLLFPFLPLDFSFKCISIMN